MKRTQLAVGALLALFVVTGCNGPVVLDQRLHPPSWIHGEWGIITVIYTFTATTVIQTDEGASLDLGELYRVLGTPVTETITSTLYSFTTPTETGYETVEFSKVDANTIEMKVITEAGTIGHVPLFRL